MPGYLDAHHRKTEWCCESVADLMQEHYDERRDFSA
jgi:hypothetical protein